MTLELGEVLKIDRAAASHEECGSLPYIGLEHIEKDTGTFVSEYRRIPETLLATKFRFTPHHVLYGKLRPYLNKVVRPNFDGVCTTEILPLRPNEAFLDSEYLYFLLQSPRFVKWATHNASGANLPRLDPKTLGDYRLPLPPVSEQHLIAARLRAAQRLCRMRRYARQICDQLLSATFREFFEDQSTITKMTRLEELCERIVVGHVGETSTGYSGEGIRFLRTQNVRRMYINMEDIRYITPEFERTLKKSRIKSGDVLVSRVGANRGMSAVVRSDLNGANCANILVMTPGANLKAEYIAFLVNSPRGQKELVGESVGSAQGVINTTKLQEWRIPLPSHALQEQWVAVVRRHEQLMATAREALRQADHLFQTLLHQAFTPQ
jgi:type I restriction enzyme, S subunit